VDGHEVSGVGASLAVAPSTGDLMTHASQLESESGKRSDLFHARPALAHCSADDNAPAESRIVAFAGTLGAQRRFRKLGSTLA